MRPHKSEIFLALCLAFVLGIFLGRYLPATQYAVIMAAAAMIFIMLATLFWSRKPFMLAAFCGLALLGGMWRLAAHLPDTNAPNFISRHYGQEVALEGIVVEDPDVRADRVNLTVNPLSISPYPARGGQGEKPIGSILLNAGRYPEYRYGDKLKISGKIEEPFETEDFSYKNYLSRYGIYATMRFPEIEKVAAGQGHPLKAGLLAVKHRFLDVLSRALPEPHNGLIGGLILGLKRAIPENLREVFVVAGISHIVVVSGYNISLITRNILHTRLFLGRRVAFWLSLATVLCFVVLTGAEASVVRAAVMGMLLVLAINVGRIYQAATALVAAGAVMVAVNPQILALDIGFQLSFLATLGLIFLAPVFDKWFEKIPNFLQFRANLSSTLAAQIFTLPLLIYYFDRISLIAPLVNVLVLWVIPYSMFFGFFLGLAGMIYLPAAKILSGILWVFLEYIIRVSEFFASFPFAAASAAMPVWGVAVCYLALGAAVWTWRLKKGFYHQLEYVKVKL